MAEDYNIQFGQYSSEVIEKVEDLFHQAFPRADKFTKEYLTWQYLDNPNGHVVSFNAWTGDDGLAAHYAAIPVRMVIAGNIETGLLSLNTATHPMHQGKGLFVKLATATYEYARQNGYKYVIGVANDNSTHGFLKRLGFDLIAPLNVKIGWGNAYANEISTGVDRVYYDKDTLLWRLRCPQFTYSAKDSVIYGSINIPLFHTTVATIPDGIAQEDLNLKMIKNL